MLRQEMNIGYFELIHRPGEKLGVLDNRSDFECCAERTHCNATHDSLTPAVVWDEEKKEYRLDDSKTAEKLKRFHDVIEGKRHSLLGGGEHNNVYFPGFYAYRQNIPQALMQDPEGRYLELHDRDILGGKPIPMPAIDDPTLLRLYAQQMAAQAEKMPGCHYVAGYVLGGEMLYPEYFGLGHGDYRPVSWNHFRAWCRWNGEQVPEMAQTLEEGSRARELWLRFREQAMADRAAFYYQAILDRDPTHLCYYPTHGSMMHGKARANLSQQPDTLGTACDGIEMGHILIDDDAERRNVILTTLNTSYGFPVIVPRLGNKTPDFGAAGSGRSFTPAMLRRLVYEDVGMGIPVIFPIHWRSHLHDGEWFIKNTPAEAECRKVFDEIITAAPYLNAMGRLQPQVGILASDATWLRKFEPRWTALMQDLLTDRIHAAVVTDAIVEKGLARRMPLLILVDDAFISEQTMQKLTDYLEEGGHLLIWGIFAENSTLRETVLSHPNCMNSRARACGEKRVLREMFLAGVDIATDGNRYIFHAVDAAALKEEMRTLAPEVVLQPFHLTGTCGETNVYPLTDRASLGCVCVNNGVDAAEFSIVPDPRLLSAYDVTDMLTGKEVRMPVRLDGFATLLLLFTPKMTDLEEAVCRAEDAFVRWRSMGCAVGALRHYYSNCRTGRHYEKRYALASGLLSSMALRCRTEALPEGGVKVAVEALDAAGKAVQDAYITMRLTPGSMKSFQLPWNGSEYACCLRGEDLPRVYDPETAEYRPLEGPARIILQAENESLQGGCLVNIRLEKTTEKEGMTVC